MLPGRDIRSEDLQKTDALLVRSITKINGALLDDTAVKFVGSASAGVDHVDFDYLNARKLGFASSPGSNANSVAEYVIAALLTLAHQQHWKLSGKTIGIVGVGHIGKLVKRKSEALGMKPLLNDPFLAQSGEIEHRPLEEVLGCDVVTLHVPITVDGPFPTFHLINRRSLTYVKPSTIFINASRGEVVDTQALLEAIQQARIGPTVLDVWEHEPHISWELFEAVSIGTPHIAGHSLDGKAAGTSMIYSALCKHFDIAPGWNPSQSLPSPTVPSFTVSPSSRSDEEVLKSIVTKVYDVEADYQRMKTVASAPREERTRLFDNLRKHYPVRREFHGTTVYLPDDKKILVPALAELGFLHG